jgi:hypothetical protein
MKSIRGWASAEGMNYWTATKRRSVAGVGVCVPPGTWMLTRKEWETVKKTPLPGCRRVRG